MRRDRFYNFNENTQRKETKMSNAPRLDFEALVASLASVCSPFGSMLVVVGTLFETF